MLRGRHGLGWMVVGWLALALIMAASLWLVVALASAPLLAA